MMYEMNDNPEGINEDIKAEHKEATFSWSATHLQKKIFPKSKVSLKTAAAGASIVLSSDITDNSHNVLQDMCVRAHQFQRHAHRDTLTVSDVSKASNFYEFSRISTVEGNKSKDINLDSYEDNVIPCGEKQHLYYFSRGLHCPCVDATGVMNNIDKTLKDYFILIMKSILKNDSEVFTISLSDLKINYFIAPLLPLFIQNLCNDIVLIKYDPVQLKRVLQIVQSLYQNPGLYFCNCLLHKIFNFGISCAINNLNCESHSFEDNCSMRDSAAELLGIIFTKCETDITVLYEHSLDKLKFAIQKNTLNLLSCYGSLAVVNALGLSAIAQILPLIFTNHSNGVNGLLKAPIEHDIKQAKQESLSDVVQRKLFDICCRFLLNCMHEMKCSLDSSEFKIIFPDSEDSHLFESVDDITVDLDTEDDITLNLNLCLIILEHFGEDMCSSLPTVENKLNEKIPLKKFFEIFLQKDIAENLNVTSTTL